MVCHWWGGEVRPNNCTGKLTASQYTHSPTTKPGVCHHFRECGINSLVARMPVAGRGQKRKKQNLTESINKICWQVFFLSFHQLLCYAHLAFENEEQQSKKMNKGVWTQLIPSATTSLTTRTANRGWTIVTSTEYCKQNLQRSWIKGLPCSKCACVTIGIPPLHEKLYKSKILSVIVAI